MKLPILLDTDIGSDVDDALALLYAAQKRLDVKLITTVHGDTQLRAKIAAKICRSLGYDVPVAAGEQMPIKQRHIYTTGLEDDGFTRNEPSCPDDAVDRIIATSHKYATQVDVVAIGPLTNIARAIDKDADLTSCIRHLYCMGNAVVADHPFTVHNHQMRSLLNYRCHNFKADPEAVDIVMEASIPTTIVTTAVCKENHITLEEIARIDAHLQNPATAYIRSAAQRWLPFIGYEKAFLYDPLVLHHAIDLQVTEAVQDRHLRVTTRCHYDYAATFLDSLMPSPR